MAVCEDLFPGRFVSAEFFRLEIKIGMPYSRIARRNAGEKFLLGLPDPRSNTLVLACCPLARAWLRISPVVAKAGRFWQSTWMKKTVRRILPWTNGPASSAIHISHLQCALRRETMNCFI